ncbi:MAG: hypothetical protein NT023_05220 [Armatimonadetes bacterium]|nr:hypothetical protein [Armatimonadota bacterium]
MPRLSFVKERSLPAASAKAGRFNGIFLNLKAISVIYHPSHLPASEPASGR